MSSVPTAKQIISPLASQKRNESRKSKPHHVGPIRTSSEPACISQQASVLAQRNAKNQAPTQQGSSSQTCLGALTTLCQAGVCFCTNSHKDQPRRDFFHVCLRVFDGTEDSNRLLTFATSHADKIKANLQWEVTTYSSKYFP